LIELEEKTMADRTAAIGLGAAIAAGGAGPGSPDAKRLWVEKSSGPEASLDWKVRDGNYGSSP
jgi:hypothetical protein